MCISLTCYKAYPIARGLTRDTPQPFTMRLATPVDASGFSSAVCLFVDCTEGGCTPSRLALTGSSPPCNPPRPPCSRPPVLPGTPKTRLMAWTSIAGSTWHAGYGRQASYNCAAVPVPRRRRARSGKDVFEEPFCPVLDPPRRFCVLVI